MKTQFVLSFTKTNTSPRATCPIVSQLIHSTSCLCGRTVTNVSN